MNIIRRKVSYADLLAGGVVVAIMLISLLEVQSVYAAITTELDYGERGEDVTELQTYLSTNSAIYPSGLVTGYFGPLTQAGVQRFQVSQGIVSSGTPSTTGYGRVGPRTMARINALLGGGQVYNWDTTPVLSGPLVQVGPTSATISWVTNEPTQGQVYYDIVPLRTDEATGPNQRPYISGTLVPYAAQLQGSHTVVVSGLQPNTTYYYTTRGIDSGGQMSMTWPSSFKTTQ